MKTPKQQRSKRDIQLAVVCVLGTIITWRFIDHLGPSEFSGGTVTGLMFRLQSLAGDLYPLAAFVAFFYPSVAAGIALIAGILALPVYVSFLAPGPFQNLFSGEWSHPAMSNFNLDPWSLVGVGTIAAVVFISIRIFRPARLFTSG